MEILGCVGGFLVGLGIGTWIGFRWGEKVGKIQAKIDQIKNSF